MEKVILKILDKIKKTPTEAGLYSDLFDAIKILLQSDKPKAFSYNKRLRKLCLESKRLSNDLDFVRTLEDIRKETYHIEAKDIFDSYLIFIEWNREPQKKFYLPRRRVLKPLVQDLQDLADHKIKFLGISLPPRECFCLCKAAVVIPQTLNIHCDFIAVYCSCV